MKWWKRSADRALQATPPCDRCGNPTGRPWLFRMPRTVWHCSACEQAVAELWLDIYFPAARPDPGSST
jgi:ribosomal protein L37AE/L43A